MPKKGHAKSLQTDRRCFLGRGHGLFSRPPAGTRNHRVELWQLKCSFEIRRTLSVCRVICGTHGLFEFELRSPSLEGEG